MPSKRASLIPVSERALVQRINRKLKETGEQLKKCRSNRWRGELGDYFRIDISRNAIVDKHIDLEECGRETGALALSERLERDE